MTEVETELVGHGLIGSRVCTELRIKGGVHISGYYIAARMKSEAGDHEILDQKADILTVAGIHHGGKAILCLPEFACLSRERVADNGTESHG